MKTRKKHGNAVNKAWFKKQMALNGYTQRTTGEKIGICSTQISQMYAGVRKMPGDEAYLWAQLLNVSVDEVLENAYGFTPVEVSDSERYGLLTRTYSVEQDELAKSIRQTVEWFELGIIDNLYKGISDELKAFRSEMTA